MVVDTLVVRRFMVVFLRIVVEGLVLSFMDGAVAMIGERW
jgi:hypothetical protein